MDNDNQLPPAPVAEEVSSDEILQDFDFIVEMARKGAGSFEDEVNLVLVSSNVRYAIGSKPAIDVDALADFIFEVSDWRVDWPHIALAKDICNWIEEQQNDQ